MEYKTIQGDTWDVVAFKMYGNERLFPLIMTANPQHINTVIFDAGIALCVPDKPDETADDLPPWKRDDAG